ncbi:site-2 protease family protein [Halorientalis salina]|uniref:site-2 protease family protein n=1 Tax=Halorientalis salina TaxID=2932266 RepID=UPI0010AD2BDD|nr:site-2 protease family protein [Halorientalis salina]
MAGSGVPGDAPPADELSSVFRVYEVRTDGDKLLYIGRPAASADALEREVLPLFRQYDYDVTLRQQYQPDRGPGLMSGNYALVAKPQSMGLDGIPWTNVVLAVLTVLSTLFVGASLWYDIDIGGDPTRLLDAWPFTLAVLGVLGTHELGHYVMSRYHRVDASLPYFLPVPTIFGTMGAVIKMKGRIPHRKALFDIGVAGPLAGLGATVVVTVIGLHLPPVTVPLELTFNHPPMLQALSAITGQPLSYSDPHKIFNPVVFGGWLGMFITFLNLLPVGQLDGGHIVRAMFGERTETLSAAVPAGLFGLGLYLYIARSGEAVYIWFIWGLLALGLAYAGPTDPIDDAPLDRKRYAVGALTFLLGLACFTPIPIEVAV